MLTRRLGASHQSWSRLSWGTKRTLPVILTWLAEGDEPQSLEILRRSVNRGLPCGSEKFIQRLEKMTERALRCRLLADRRRRVMNNGSVPFFSPLSRVRIFRGYSAARCSRRQMPHIHLAEQVMHAHVKPGIGYTCVIAKGIAVGRHRRRDEGDEFPEQERL